MKRLEDYVRSIPDFPEEGIIFRDITTVLQDKDGLRMAVDQMQACLGDVEYDVVKRFYFWCADCLQYAQAVRSGKKKGKAAV